MGPRIKQYNRAETHEKSSCLADGKPAGIPRLANRISWISCDALNIDQPELKQRGRI
jgi:hypothetical protein